MITRSQLDRFIPGSGSWSAPINEAASRFDISTHDRMAAFLAQTAHESGGFKRLVENLNYSADGLSRTWPLRYRGPDGQPNETALRLHRNQEAIANNCYAGRMGNGDEASGDGWRYRGRGLIQITGRENYAACGSALGLPLLDHPELLEQPDGAAMSAAWFWQTNGCNELADVAAFSTITRRINGGLNGQSDRVRYWIKAQAALEIA